MVDDFKKRGSKKKASKTDTSRGGSGRAASRSEASRNSPSLKAGKGTFSEKRTRRLNKLIADSGYCSRREADRLIAAGKVKINGEVVDVMGYQVELGKDKVQINDHPLPRRMATTILFNKPSGLITTRSDELGRRTVYDLLAKRYHHCDPVGRLDRQSSGALLFTNDGDLLFRLTHPRFHVEKVYQATLDYSLEEADNKALLEGVLLEPEGRKGRFDKLTKISPRVYETVLTTGMNRQVRRMFASLGYDVLKLKRLSVGPVTLKGLRLGGVRAITAEELKSFRDGFKNLK